MSKDSILFVFEGPKGEGQIVRNMEKVFFDKGLQIIKCAYGGDIYQLYTALNQEDNEFVDLLELIKERSKLNPQLKKYNHEFLTGDTRHISQIYIFFDYDGQDLGANAHGVLGDDKIKELLVYFDNETENGKLFISYPMVEALKDIRNKDTFQELCVKCKKNNCIYKTENEECESCTQEPHYKTVVNQNCIPGLKDITRYDFERWKLLIGLHLSKMNYIVHGLFQFPDEIESQLDIFMNQKNKYIDKKCPEVSVLSAFPVFILDFYGLEYTKELVK